MILSLFAVYAGIAEEAETSTVIQCGTLSLELPEGITPIEESAAYTAAAIADFGDAFEVCLIASDAAQIRLLTVSSAEYTDSAKTAAELSAMTLLGSADTLSEFTGANNSGFTFSCSIDSVNYDIFYLGNDTTVYCIVCAGLSEQEQQEMLDSIVLA